MKKNYLFLAAATTLFAACVQTDVVTDIPEPQQQAISFETFANKQTRATENSSASYSQDLGSHHETFEVYAYKNVSDQMVFNDEVVSRKTSPVINNGTVTEASTWGYKGQVYWDKAATEYNFYAAAPAEDYWKFNEVITDNKVDQTKSYFTIESHEINDHNATLATGDNAHKYVDVFGNKSTDLMIASKEQVTSSSTQALFQPVQLDFIHILSRLNITVSKDASLNDQVVTLNSLTVYNVRNIGSFNENAELNSTLNEGTYERWNPTNNVTSYSSLTNEELTTDAQYMLQSLVIPQTAGHEHVTLAGNQSYTQPYFKIIYTIKEMDNSNPAIELSSEEFTAYYNLANAFGYSTGGSLPFNEGWQNTLNITIMPTAIEFNSNVAVWADKNNNDSDSNDSGDDLTIQ